MKGLPRCRWAALGELPVGELQRARWVRVLPPVARAVFSSSGCVRSRWIPKLSRELSYRILRSPSLRSLPGWHRWCGLQLRGLFSAAVTQKILVSDVIHLCGKEFTQ